MADGSGGLWQDGQGRGIGREIGRRIGRSITWSLLHPSYDRLLLYGFANWFSRLSRAWADGLAALAAEGVDGDPEAALGQLALDPAVAARDRAGLIRALSRLGARRAGYARAEARWQAAFFGAGPAGPRALERVQGRRLRAAERFMTARAAFFRWRRHYPSARWEIATPEEITARHGARLAAAEAFPAPAPLAVTRSAVLSGRRGASWWLRYPAPVLDGEAWARVHEPPDGRVRATLVYLHGILVENEMIRTPESAVLALAERGFRVVLPEAPWHGRRRIEGYYGGEPILARGPLGMIELFEAWVAEVAGLTGWLRGSGSGPIAVGGISLGALTAQLVASAARGWPAPLCPDALLLVATSGSMVELALGSSLTRSLGLPAMLREAGWSREALERFRPLFDPAERPAVAPERIVIALGEADDLTPYRGGLELARRWRLPEENLILRHPGHFTLAVGLFGDPAPYRRLSAVMGV